MKHYDSVLTNFFLTCVPGATYTVQVPDKTCAYCGHTWKPSESGKCRNCGGRLEP